MDPLTAALQLATQIARIYELLIASADETQKRELMALWLEDQKAWRTLFLQLLALGK